MAYCYTISMMLEPEKAHRAQIFLRKSLVCHQITIFIIDDHAYNVIADIVNIRISNGGIVMRGRSINGTLRSSKVMTVLSKNLGRIKGFGVRRIGLFGSVIRGEAGPKSDVDILVEFDEGQATFDNLMGLHDFLTGILKRKVDLVTMGGLSPFIGPHILKEVRYVEGAS